MMNRIETLTKEHAEKQEKLASLKKSRDDANEKSQGRGGIASQYLNKSIAKLEKEIQVIEQEKFELEKSESADYSATNKI